MNVPEVAGPAARLKRLTANPGDTQELALRKMLLVGVAIAAVFIGPVWGTLYLSFGEPLASVPPFIYGVGAAISLLIFVRTRNARAIALSQLWMLLLLPFAVMLALGGFSNSSAVVIWSLLTPLGALLWDEPARAPRWLMAYLALLVAGAFAQPYLLRETNLPDALVYTFQVMNLTGVGLIAFSLFAYFVHQKEDALRRLRIEQDKSESLLLNVLPRDVAAILKNENRTIAHHIDAASILFADVVDFTPLSSRLPPVQTVELLNEVFSYFDDLVDDYGLEKIKTIGDCYMVAAGVPRPRSDHAHVLAHIALDIQDYVAAHLFANGIRLRFRIGINSGPVIAGVIGRKKFIYDLWGDAVNTASRMESHGLGGEIQLTESTYQLLKDDFICEPRGTIFVKGKGEMPTWYLKASRHPRAPRITRRDPEQASLVAE